MKSCKLCRCRTKTVDCGSPYIACNASRMIPGESAVAYSKACPRRGYERSRSCPRSGDLLGHRPRHGEPYWKVRSLHEFRNHHSDDGCAYAEAEVTQQYYFHLHTSRS